LSEGGYEAISRQLFRKVAAQRLLLEYDDPRSGTFEALQDMPEDKFVILGLVTTKRAILESREELKQRILDAARYIALERLGISPQCGFASSIIGNNISFQEQKRKLALVVTTAAAIWG
jgi:5-methyltetrahydropteroyltriglutamate--homocysteine methyltransferase